MENKSSECIYPLCDTADSRDISRNLSPAWISQSASYEPSLRKLICDRDLKN